MARPEWGIRGYGRRDSSPWQMVGNDGNLGPDRTVECSWSTATYTQSGPPTQEHIKRYRSIERLVTGILLEITLVELDFRVVRENVQDAMSLPSLHDVYHTVHSPQMANSG